MKNPFNLLLMPLLVALLSSHALAQDCTTVLNSKFPGQATGFQRTGILNGERGGASYTELGGSEISSILTCSKNLNSTNQIVLKNLKVVSDLVLSPPAHSRSLSILDSEFEKSVKFEAVGWSNNITFVRNAFLSSLDASGIEVSGFMDISGSVFHGDVNFSRARFGSDFTFSSDVSPDANSTVYCSLINATDGLQSVVHGEVDLSGIRVDGQLCIAGLSGPRQQLAESLLVGSIQSERVLIIQSKIKKIILHNANVKDRINLGRTTSRYVDLSEADSPRILLMGMSSLDELVLEKAKVSDFLLLSHPTTRTICWNPGARMNLSSANIGRIEHIRSVSPPPWPSLAVLDGAKIQTLSIPVDELSKDEIEYRNLRESTMSCPVSDGGHVDRQNRVFFLQLLKSIEGISRPTVLQLSAIARQIDGRKLANNVQYDGEETIRSDACAQGQVGRCAFLSLRKYLVGYGIDERILRILGPVTFFLFLGTVVGRKTYFSEKGNFIPAGTRRSRWEIKAYERWIESAYFSLDRLVPILKIGASSVTPTGKWARAYFLVHSIIGWIFGFFIVSGVTALLLG